MSFRPLGTDEVEAAAALVVDAFQDDVVAMWKRERTARGRIMFEAEIQSMLAPMARQGHVLVNNDVTALAAWTDPPNVSTINRSVEDELIIRRAARAQYGWRWLWRYREPEFLQFYPPREEHSYLAYLAVAPDLRGQGIGSEILKAWLAVVDEQSHAAFLDNSNAANLALYEKHGFRVLDEFRAHRGAPSTWRMWRDARKD